MAGFQLTLIGRIWVTPEAWTRRQFTRWAPRKRASKAWQYRRENNHHFKSHASHASWKPIGTPMALQHDLYQPVLCEPVSVCLYEGFPRMDSLATWKVLISPLLILK
jgi:hypothetical protein